MKQLDYVASKYGDGITKAVAVRLMIREKINFHTEDWRKQVEAEKCVAESNLFDAKVNGKAV